MVFIFFGENEYLRKQSETINVCVQRGVVLILKNHLEIMSTNSSTHIVNKIHREFYHRIVHIANEGDHNRSSHITLLK